MATFRTLPSGSINVQIRHKDQKQITKTFKSKQEAEQWLHEEEAAHSTLIPPLLLSPSPHQVPSIYELGMRYCDEVLINRSSYSTCVRRMERFNEHLPKPIRSLNSQQVNEYRLKRLKEVKPVTVRDELQLLSRIYHWAYSELLLDAKETPNPVELVKLPKGSKPSSKVVSREELTELLEGLRGTSKLVVELLFETACRRSEIVFLTAGAIDLEERTIFLEETKTDVERYVPLTKRALTILKGCMEDKDRPERLFNITPAAITRACAKVRKEKNLHPHVRPHQLRHSRITEVARKGFNQGQLALVSGHRDPRSLARYTHLSVKDVIDLID